jgi:hypothetical protein
LSQAEGFVTAKLELECDGQYRLRDFWNGHRGFEVFRERCSEDFAEFDRQIVQELVEREEFLGAYYEKPEDPSEEDLVFS